MSERPPYASLSHVRCAPVAAETLPPGEVFDTGSPNDSGVSGSKLARLARAAGTPTTAASLVGESFGDYELLAELGRGGMGVVYRAHQKSLDRPVALKMLLRDHFIDAMRLARFRTEARAVATLNHPNIVQLYQVGECPFGHFFTMELLEGATLEALARKGKIAVPWATACVATVAEAIHFAHGQGVIHRDLKPANLLVEKGGRPVVMDFGIAKFRDRSAGLTQQGTLMGTPAYMAPEQAGEDPQLEVGPYSDVYALGAILYTLLTNRPPYDGGTPLRPVRQFRPAVPPALERVCMTCLAKKPADRYPTAAALAEALRRLLDAAAGDPPAVTLLVGKAEKQLRLTKGCTLVGRSSECDVVLKSSDVSKRHCRVLRQPDGVFVEDLDSVNGISVNGQPVRRARLCDGDRLEIVRNVFQVRLS